MQPASLNGRQQQLGLLMGRAQPDVLEAARVAALFNGQSNSFHLQSGLGGTGLGSGGLGGLGSTQGGLNLSLGSLPQSSQPAQQASQLDQLALLSQFPHALFPQQYNSADRDLQLGGLRNVGKTRSSDSRSSSAYASRHQAAEQRRRTRINERLELLRKLVPHAERANTACFLEEVIKYIEALKRRTLDLEAMLESATGKSVSKSVGLQGMSGALGSTLDPGLDSQAPSPRHAASAGGQGVSSSQQIMAQQPPQAGGAAPSSPLAPPAPTAQQVQQQQQEQLQSHQAAAQQQLHFNQTASQLAQLLPSAQQQGAASQQQQVLFPHSGGLSLAGGQLSLGGNLNSMSLAQFTAGLQAQHQLQHAQNQLATHHHMAQQLSDLQTIHVMQSLQHSRSSHPPAFHPTNNKAFLHFNEDLFGSIKPELHPSRSLLGAAASTTPSTSLQLTTAHLPTDSNTLMQVETTRKTLSGSPVSSEESGVPLKKRKVLLL